MKKSILALAIICVAVSCTKNVDKMRDGRKKRLITETWTISYFQDNDTNITTNYLNYEITFEDDGGLEVQHSGGKERGTWVYGGPDNSQLIISITGSPELDELTQNWTLRELSKKEVELEYLEVGSAPSEISTLMLQR